MGGSLLMDPNKIITTFMLLLTTTCASIWAIEEDLLRPIDWDKAEYMDQLINEFAPFNIQNENGDSALHRTVKANDERAVRIMLQANCINIFLRNKEGRTPLCEAVLTGNRNLVETIVRIVEIKIIRDGWFLMENGQLKALKHRERHIRLNSHAFCTYINEAQNEAFYLYLDSAEDLAAQKKFEDIASYLLMQYLFYKELKYPLDRPPLTGDYPLSPPAPDSEEVSDAGSDSEYSSFSFSDGGYSEDSSASDLIGHASDTDFDAPPEACHESNH